MDHIVDCIESDEQAVADGKAGWMVVKILKPLKN